MKFHEKQFPAELSFGATGGPKRRAEITQLANGYEHINVPWSKALRYYNVSTGTKVLDDLQKIVDFFEFCNGCEYGFRWKDWSDFKSSTPSNSITATDQILGFGDGVKKLFQIQKKYGTGVGSFYRQITKPVLKTVLVAIDENVRVIERDFHVDYSSGIIEFKEAPETGAPVTAGFEFDVPVRFDTDEILLAITHFDAGEIQNIDFKEVMIWN